MFAVLLPLEVIWSYIKSGSRITTTTTTTTTATPIFTSIISNPYLTITILYPYHNLTYLTSIATITLRLHYHHPTPITTTTTTTVTEVTFLTNHNNLNWPNTSTHVVCWRCHDSWILSTSAKFNDLKSVCFVSKLYCSPVFYLFYCAHSKYKIGFILEYELLRLVLLGLLSLFTFKADGCPISL